jgi:predicted Rossmann-fold nucleotide-binding protein
MSLPVEKIVSGGQTGVDRAALDVALELDMPCGGWCPQGRSAEDGQIPVRYPLQETEGRKYKFRTSLNVRDSDATLILNVGPLEGGTGLTKILAVKLRRPYLVVELDKDQDTQAVQNWLKENSVKVLNVAGPRESKRPGIHQQAADYLKKLLSGEGG